MRREIHIRISFGDLLYLWQCLRCLFRHRSVSGLREGLREKRLQFTGGDPTWEPFTLGDWIELRRWRAWAAREHECDPEPAPWRHERPSRPLPRAVTHRDRASAAMARVIWCRRNMIYPGLSCIAVSGGSFAGMLIYAGHTFVGMSVVLVMAVLCVSVLRYLGRLD